MTNQQTIDKLREMRLTAMAEQFLQQTNQADMQDLTCDDRFGMIVEPAWRLVHSSKKSIM